MTTLRVVIDDIVAPGAGRLSRYAEDLTRALIRTAPRGADVAGFVAASPEGDYALIRDLLPGLRDLHKSALARRELAAAWQHGFTVLPGTGMVHSTSLLAPMRRHDRASGSPDQTVVTIHDAIAWTHPDILPARQVSWTKAMGRRAERYADAVVVPTHAVADELAEHLDLGDRVRVIGAAAATVLTEPADAAARRRRLELPDRYVVAAVEGDPRNGFADLVAASGALGGVPVVLLASAGETAGIAGIETITVREDLGSEDAAAVIAQATAFVQPAIAAGFGAAMLDAMALGTPVVATDIPALAETAADAALLVPRGDDAAGALGEALAALLDDPTRLERLAVAGEDRARAFSWRDAAEKIWQLHADL